MCRSKATQPLMWTWSLLEDRQVMDVSCRGEPPTQQLHQRHLRPGGDPQVVTTDHIGDAQPKLIGCRGQVIRQKAISAPQHHITNLTEPIQVAAHLALFRPVQTACRKPHTPAGQSPLAGAPIRGKAAAGPWIQRPSTVGR